MQQVDLSGQLAILFKNACLAELEALKPGNVHIFADGHGMVVQDFIKSAEAASKVIAQAHLSVGERILQAVSATWNAVHCNTNLGIILLSAPILQAAFSQHEDDYQKRLLSVLHHLNVADAELCYQAIAIANPAGLGQLAQHDVRDKPTITLLEAMEIAAPHDIIARQYQTGYADLFSFGITVYEKALKEWQRPAWATTLLYLSYLASWPDSHIARKHGESSAIAIQKEAVQHYHSLMAYKNPKQYLPQLLAFDASLKARHFNPGSSADLTVATLLISAVVGLV